MITGFNMQNKCSKIESKGKHQGEDKEILLHSDNKHNSENKTKQKLKFYLE